MICLTLVQRRRPPAWIARIEAGLLKRACLKAAARVGLSVPTCEGRDALTQFREVTLALATATNEQPALRGQLANALGEQAERLGRFARTALRAGDDDAFAVLRFLYEGIGISISGELPGELRFHACSFASSYSPDTCKLMSAMDEGVMRGLAGTGDLVFSARITEGCDCCRACFSERKSRE